MWRRRILVAGLVLAALNLRPALTSLGALLEEVRVGLHMGGGAAGVVTSLPAVCFMVFGITVPRLTRRFGLETVVCAGMLAVTAGLALRPLTGGTAGFLLLSVLSLMGIAVGNVLVPVIVKRHFPRRIGAMTGLYSMALALGTAVPAAAAVPLTRALGGHWRDGLGVWAAPAALAVVPWLLLARAYGGAGGRNEAHAHPTADAPDAVPTDAAPGAAPNAAPRGLVRSGTAWALACYFGLQSASAFITMGWMPQRFRDAGIPAGTAGALLAVAMSMSVPLAFVIPRLATRMRNQAPIVLALAMCGLAAVGGLYAAPAAGAWAWVWAVLLGISNCSFPLALTMIGIRAGTGAGVARLSAFAQSIGYLISIPGPLLVGVLYQHSGGWGRPLALMAGLLVPQMAAGALAGRNRTVDGDAVGNDALHDKALHDDAVHGDAVRGDALEGGSVGGWAADGRAVDGRAVDGRAVPPHTGRLSEDTRRPDRPRTDAAPDVHEDTS